MTNFEVRQYDAAGRLGELTVPRAGVTVETPTILPVVNPHVQTVAPATLASEFGAEILITNSYILHGSEDLREPVLEQGLHNLLGFDGAIMTDSGSFQLAEYGDIDVTTEEILEFQHEIGSDIGTPVDIPTPPDVDRERATEELETTQERLEHAATVDTGEMLVSAPVQGATYPDLRERAASDAVSTGLDVFPLGAVVPLMNEYRYADLADVVAACKRGLGEVGPVHLFGAGHPMMFAMAAALGCDLFDSAAYALYARDDRYLTVQGTELLDELSYFPCHCPVCTDHTPADLKGMADDRREKLLARHNLHVTYGEIRTVKQAIRSGNLMELVDSRARGHPAMLDGYRALLDHAEQLERTDPVSKDAFFYTSSESARRPEVRRHQDRLERLPVEGDDVLLTEGSSSAQYDESWGVLPPFGPYPRELADTYPLTAETPDRTDRAAYETAATGVQRLVELHPDVSFTLVHDDWPATALDRVPDRVRLRDLHARD
ncbi:archaeosine tRNA-ribosyltransferase [Haloarcula vallismortis]|uniref:tRNA-guanine(15) transglycosylase n=2 Tax=Haloarcula vallismortis TaxID=28442 RepID=M0IYG4_HALVA|nr:tRNA guanosine(15) transglycosylase TgtA [Haloarcula vallismortis]EMA00834.1 7-cyano-7-deazaguanine tRNA-ribosyltransferase [Haloarcula vallismortis ATCC 29715]SDW07112.1 archaeosine tRNA-ribosyltransferase [Haloarcula vallismortis]